MNRLRMLGSGFRGSVSGFRVYGGGVGGDVPFRGLAGFGVESFVFSRLDLRVWGFPAQASSLRVQGSRFAWGYNPV